ncbi:MAG: NADH-quinone oxidoreductase subunit J [Bacteroidota bacterium]
MELKYLFILFSILIIGSALFVLFSKSVVYAAFMLFFTFMGVSAIFVMANADFLAVSQIMIYIGGILVLLVFGVLLTNQSEKSKINQVNTIQTSSYNRLLGGLIAIILSASLFFVFDKIPFARLEGQHFDFFEAPKSTIQGLGMNLIVENSIPLEAVGILLIGALIGAGFIAKSTLFEEKIQK